VARQFGLAATTVRAIDLRYLQRSAAARRKPVLRQNRNIRFWLGGLPVPGRKLIKSNYQAATASFYLTVVINVNPVPKVIHEEIDSVIGCCQPFLHPNASAVDTGKSE
jgi:hypothetical protein